MNIIEILDLGNHSIHVVLRVGSSIPRRSPNPISFENPFDADDRKELRWYLEDYLQSPYEDWRAKRVEERMAQWGEALFNRVFVKNAPNPDPHTLYQEAVREGLENTQLCISSEDPNFLNIPWELIRDPTPGRGYLAPSLAGLFRYRTGQKLEFSRRSKLSKPFRILLVISRPYGERDIPFRTIARPMLEALRQLWPRIQIEILRPPTFDALVNRLNTKRGYYDLVHFDGHGVFYKPSLRSHMQYSLTANSGHLVFEKDDGTEHIVDSQELG
jgi:hypothetical protein